MGRSLMKNAYNLNVLPELKEALTNLGFKVRLATAEEITAIGAGLSSGVTVVTSIHAGSFDQLKQKPQFGPLVRSGAFRWVVLLSTPEKPFMIREVSQL